jgi:threonine/homoserine/homoserine lactone efflux protein
MRPAWAAAERPAGKSFKLYGYALLISFTGSLQVGTLNVSIADLVIDRRVGEAILFGMGAMLVEVGLVRVALGTIKRLEGMTRLSRWFQLLACIIILVFAYISLEAAWHGQKARPADPIIGARPFLSGVILSLLNPLHLPFWMGWTAVLRSKGLLTDARREYNLYVMAIGTGTGGAFLAYGIVGNLLIAGLRANQSLLNGLVGGALFVTGLVQARKVCRRWQLL